jgi:hypothetical protein
MEGFKLTKCNPLNVEFSGFFIVQKTVNGVFFSKFLYHLASISAVGKQFMLFRFELK